MVRARAAERQRSAEAAWANQVASIQATPFLSDELRDAHRADWERRLGEMRARLSPDNPDLLRQEGLFAVWGWASYVGEAEVNDPGRRGSPRFGLPERIYEAQLRRADAAEEWGAMIAQACERSRGRLAPSDPLWVALVHDMIRWEQARGASAPELADWYDTMVQASDAAYGELSDFSLAMLCERALALGKAGDAGAGMRAIGEYLRRRKIATPMLSDAQYMRHELLADVYQHDTGETMHEFLALFNQDAKDLSEQTTGTYFIYSGQIYGMWLYDNAHYEEADRVLSELLQVMRSPLANTLTTARLVYRVGVCRMLLGKPEHAIDLLQETETMLMSRSIARYQQCYLARVRGWLGQCRSDLGRYEEAEPALLAAHEWFRKHAIEEHDLTETILRLTQLYERWGKNRRSGGLARQARRDRAARPRRAAESRVRGGAEGEAPPGWRISSGSAEGAAGAVITREGAAEGAACVRVPAPSPGQTTNGLSQDVSFLPYRGMRVRVSASVRVEAPTESAFARFWLLMEASELDGYSYVENSTDRPIRWKAWDRFGIEFDVRGDAAVAAFGLTVHGEATAWLDDVRIEVLGPAGVGGD